jgi:hypothetical protein
MGSSTSSADTTQIKNDINTLKLSMTGLTTKVNNFQAASINYTDLSSGLVNTPDNLNKIISGLTNIPDKLATAIVPGMASNTTLMNSITNAIVANKDFPASVASSLTSDPTKKAILKGDKGEPGSMGDYTALKSNLFISTLTGAKNPVTLWCADGDMCQLPKGNKGIEWGYGGSKIYDDSQLNISSDDNIYFNTKDRRMEIRNDGTYFNQDGLKPLNEQDWMRIFGSNANGTAMYNGVSINGGGGLNVGNWGKVPQGQIRTSDRMCVGAWCWVQDGDYLYLEKDGWGRVARFEAGWKDGAAGDQFQVYRDPSNLGGQYWYVNKGLDTGKVWR